MLTEIADECRYSVMFARTAETFGAPSCPPPPSILRLGKAFVKRFDASGGLVDVLRDAGLVGGPSELLRKRARMMPTGTDSRGRHVPRSTSALARPAGGPGADRPRGSPSHHRAPSRAATGRPATFRKPTLVPAPAGSGAGASNGTSCSQTVPGSGSVPATK